MHTTHAVCHRILLTFAGLLVIAPSVQATAVTVTGSNVTLLSANNINGWVAVTDTTQTGGEVKVTQNSTGSLAKFDPALGVLTNVTATAANAADTYLNKSGGGGSAGVSSSWTLGGNVASGFSMSQSNNGSLAITKVMTVTSSAAKLNNFVGSGNVANNSFYSSLSANKSSVNTAPAVGARITPNLTYGQSAIYTYATHSNASFTAPDDTNAWMIDFGALASGVGANQMFSIFDLGDLGLTNFSFSFLSGDDVFGISGGNSVAAGSSSPYDAQFLAQTAASLTSFSGVYRLSFADDVSGLAQFATNSLGSNYIDLTMIAAVAPTAVPEPGSLALLGLGLAGLAAASRRKQKQV